MVVVRFIGALYFLFAAFRQRWCTSAVECTLPGASADGLVRSGLAGGRCGVGGARALGARGWVRGARALGARGWVRGARARALL